MVIGAASLLGRLDSLSAWLMSFGTAGLFGVSLLDSALVPLPGGPDLAMMALSSANHEGVVLYALAATAGSTIGCTLLYRAARAAGAKALSKVKREKRERIENLLGRFDVLAVFIPAIMPPPFPFKAFVLSAGVFKLKTHRFVIAIFGGRLARFLIEGWLAIRFGEDARRVISTNGLKVVIAMSILVLAVIALGFFRRRRRTRESLESGEPASPGSG